MCGTFKAAAMRLAYVPLPTPGGPRNTHLSSPELLVVVLLQLLVLNDAAALLKKLQAHTALTPGCSKRCTADVGCIMMRGDKLRASVIGVNRETPDTERKVENVVM